MARLSSFLSCFFICVAAVLATVAMLAVPESAFADAGSDCVTSCTALHTPGTSEYYQCIADCCNGDADCCSSACGMDPICQTTCAGGGPPCPYTDTCNTTCNSNQCKQVSSKPTTCVAPGRVGCGGGECIKCLCDYRLKCDAEPNSCVCW